MISSLELNNLSNFRFAADHSEMSHRTHHHLIHSLTCCAFPMLPFLEVFHFAFPLQDAVPRPRSAGRHVGIGPPEENHRRRRSQVHMAEKRRPGQDYSSQVENGSPAGAFRVFSLNGTAIQVAVYKSNCP